MHSCHRPSPRTRFRTEVWWLLGVLLIGAAFAVAGALYFIWRVLQAGAGC